MAEKKNPSAEQQDAAKADQSDKDTAVTDAVAQEQGTNARGVDLNDPSLKGGTDNPDAQANNEARMQAAAGTDQPVVEQIKQARAADATVGETDKPAEK